ncbi:MAG: hypothetical protein AB1403_19405 [Candidatus Riflebacteria bacterium]
MNTSFEFMPKDRLRIRNPRVSLIIFLACSLLLAFVMFYTRTAKKRLEQDFKETSNRAQTESLRFVEEARLILPDSMVLNDLKILTEEHNNAIGNQRSCWTILFNELEEVLPANSYILNIKNQEKETSSFAAESRLFKISVAVPDMDSANNLYMKVTENKAFEAMSFNPASGQNSENFVLIEISFRFNEKNAET